MVDHGSEAVDDGRVPRRRVGEFEDSRATESQKRTNVTETGAFKFLSKDFNPTRWISKLTREDEPEDLRPSAFKVEDGAARLGVDRNVKGDRRPVIQVVDRAEIRSSLNLGNRSEEVPNRQLGVVADLDSRVSLGARRQRRRRIPYVKHVVLYCCEAVLIHHSVDQCHTLLPPKKSRVSNRARPDAPTTSPPTHLVVRGNLSPQVALNVPETPRPGATLVLGWLLNEVPQELLALVHALTDNLEAFDLGSLLEYSF